MRTLRFLFASAVGCCALIGAISFGHAGSEMKFQSRPRQHTSLLELYTSEGCSSCPPAEAWLSKLVSSPQLWTDIVPVAFHVDYWDNLGWRDRFASSQWTARQRSYAASWGNDSVYTPGFVRDGREWRQWSSSSNAATLVDAGTSPIGGQLSFTVTNGNTVQIIYHPLGQTRIAQNVSVALLGCGLNSQVKAGENSGRNLRHDFVALACQTRKLSFTKEGEIATFELPTPPEDATRLAVAVWVEEAAGGRIEQAAGGWLTGLQAK